MCNNGDWYSVCGVSFDDAAVLCKQMGHKVYPCKQHEDATNSCKFLFQNILALLHTGASWFNDGRFGQTTLAQSYIRLNCNNQFSENNWTECTLPSYCTTCLGDAIKCFSKFIYNKVGTVYLGSIQCIHLILYFVVILWSRF